MGRPWSKREVLSYLDRVMPVLAKCDHFELLDVAANADDKTIQAAFHTMASGLHPDRHRNSLNHGEHENLIVVYARIAEAYRVLRSPDHRQEYLLNVARKLSESERAHKAGKPGSGPKPAAKGQSQESALALLSPKAQQLYRRALAARRTGDLVVANLNMRMALSKHPQSGFLQAALKSLQK